MNVLKDITDFIFLENQPEKSDIIFVPGCRRPEAMENASLLFKNNFAPLILPSGKYSIMANSFEGVEVKSDIYNGDYKTEWAFHFDIAKKYGIPENAILKEDKATFTMENANFSREVTDAHSLKINKAIISCKSFHARRSYMYYKLAYPDTEFIIVPTNIDGITKDNWYLTELGREYVMTELERCGSQFIDLIKNFIVR